MLLSVVILVSIWSLQFRVISDSIAENMPTKAVNVRFVSLVQKGYSSIEST